jgi:hypothetical protein
MLSDLQIVSDSKLQEKQILTVGEADNGAVWEKIINELLEVIRTD